jgi:hypothetical protein
VLIFLSWLILRVDEIDGALIKIFLENCINIPVPHSHSIAAAENHFESF